MHKANHSVTAPVSGFDFGTSPHGLTADWPVQHQETPEAFRFSFPVDQQAPAARAVEFAGLVLVASPQELGEGHPDRASGRKLYPVALTGEQIDFLLTLLGWEVDSIEEYIESHPNEIISQPLIDADMAIINTLYALFYHWRPL